MEAAKANVEQAALNLEFTKVTSLVNGVAGIALVQIGNLVGPNSILTSVSQMDPIKAYFTVSEQEYIDFHRRYPTEATVAAARKAAQLELILGDGSVYEHKGEISVVLLAVELEHCDRSVYLKAMERKRWAFPLVGVAAARRGGETRIALAGVAPVPWLLDGSLEDATPLPRNAYKLEIARALVKRAVAALAAG